MTSCDDVIHYNNYVANSQSRPSRDSKVSPSPTITASGGALPIIGQATIIKPPDQDSTDTEDSDDSSDEKEKQVASSPPPWSGSVYSNTCFVLHVSFPF